MKRIIGFAGTDRYLGGAHNPVIAGSTPVPATIKGRWYNWEHVALARRNYRFKSDTLHQNRRLAQWESVSFTRKKSLVRSQHRLPSGYRTMVVP